jgi:SAM-dependent methyltransferase
MSVPGEAAVTEGPAVVLPVPPLRYRLLVGPLDEQLYDNPSGDLFDSRVAADRYEAVFDFGSGCGRVARQLAMQRTPPRRYLGIDINRRMVEWCQRNMVPPFGRWEFVHHDVHNPLLGQFNSPKRRDRWPCGDGEFTLLFAHSVFTHLLADQAEYYLTEIARVLRDGGMAVTTWFLFDKQQFPMMQDFQNTMFINLEDPTNAVMFDRAYVTRVAASLGLSVREEFPGFQQTLLFEKTGSGDAPSLGDRDERRWMAQGQNATVTALGGAANRQVTTTSAEAAGDARGAVVDQGGPLVDAPLRGGEIFPCVVDVLNTGTAAWLLSGDRGRVGLSLRWDTDGGNGGLQLPFLQAETVPPGASARAAFFAIAPPVPGDRRVTLSLTVDGRDVSSALYEQSVRVEVPVPPDR